jgi:F-type H+-transporting ATPase subunit delta
MIKKSIAKEYANSLYAVAGREKIKSIAEEAKFFSAVLEEYGQISRIFANPAISRESKERLVDTLGERAGFDGHFVSFIKLVIEKRRISIWREIVSSLLDICDEAEGVVRGKVMSAKPLSQKQKEVLEGEIAKKMNKKVFLEPKPAPELIGGYEVKIGSLVYDGSLRRAFEDIRTSLLKR